MKALTVVATKGDGESSRKASPATDAAAFREIKRPLFRYPAALTKKK
jgi:hypothetical protein